MDYNKIAMEIEKLISENFVGANTYAVYDDSDNEYFFYTRNKELYYSDEYQKFLMELKINRLWKQNITNFYFALDLRQNQFGNIEDNIFFESKETNNFPNWDIYNDTAPGSTNAVLNYPLAA